MANEDNRQYALALDYVVSITVMRVDWERVPVDEKVEE